MKSLLKLLGSLTLTTMPAVAVIACGTPTKEMSPQDILNLASSYITDSDLQAVNDLDLSNDKDLFSRIEGKTFSEFDTKIKDKISEFFSNKVKQNTDANPTTWFHPDVKVELSDGFVDVKDSIKSKFASPVSADLNGYSLLVAKISYSNLKPIAKTIKLTINNDTKYSTDEVKTTAITKFITEQIESENGLQFNVQELPASGEVNVANEIHTVEPNLRTRLQELINYRGLEINFSANKDATTFFTLTKANNKDKSHNFVGEANNFTMQFLINGTLGTVDTSTIKKKIVFYQNIEDANSQIKRLLTYYAPQFILQSIPESGVAYTKYITDNPDFDKRLKDVYFTSINNIYIKSVMGEKWDDKIISIVNGDNALFDWSTAGHSGQFNLNFKLQYDLLNINTTAENLAIILTEKTYNLEVDLTVTDLGSLKDTETKTILAALKEKNANLKLDSITLDTPKKDSDGKYTVLVSPTKTGSYIGSSIPVKFTIEK